MATVGEFVTDQVRPKHFGGRTPKYWNKERVILNNVKIFNGSEYVDFEPTIKMDLGKQFRTTSEYDIIAFDACVGDIDVCHGDYAEDDRGKFYLELYREIEHSKFLEFRTIEKISGTKTELEEYIKANQEFLDKNGLSTTTYCYEVRRLIRPSQLEIVSKAPSEEGK
jgi:hypothetical protein